MRFAIFVLSLLAISFAEDVEKPKDIIPIISSENIVEGIGGKFQYSYESGDGTKVMQKGELKSIDAEHAGEAVQGEYSYQGIDGQTYSLSYTADENGYQPKGDHLPTPPPVPEAIVRALAYLATLPPPKDEIENLH
ncbi:endocuticle structural glycoprotein SgAbd-3-like [Arctopsyche grandis]|uniref:endocuticle structural glycoprotein SgAbd-3-like n=1 Tax=Arctopsyche grandis TaxID=121162 RepID=UPI00406D77CF